MPLPGELRGRRLLARLDTDSLGRPLVAVDRVPTTMSLAKGLAGLGFPPGTTVLAGEQTEGRGRGGRAFVSPPGGLYLSVLLEALEPPEDSYKLGFAVAVAAREAILDAGGPAVTLVWPNDLFCGPRKVGGSLLELLSGGGRDARVIAGLGVNVSTPAASLDTEAAGPAGPLPALPGQDPLTAVAAAFLLTLETWTARLRDPDGWPVVLESFRDGFADLLGRPLTVERPDGSTTSGEAAGLADDGSLLIRPPGGELVSIRHARRVRH